jgi:glycosyltransferase involved in cell wall biosynthesis
MRPDRGLIDGGELVCVVGLRGIPGIMGGVESHCEELLPRLCERCPQLRFLVIGRRRYTGSHPTLFRNIVVYPLPAPRQQSLETLVSTFLGVLYARRVGAAAVHIHALASGLLAPLARLLGMKVFFTVHGADYDRAKWGRIARLVLRLGEKVGISNADAVICVAPSLTAGLQERYPARAARIRHVPNGISAIAAKGDAKALLDRLGVQASRFILAVGRIEPGKGFELLIEALKKTARTERLVIAGGAHHGADYAAKLMELGDDQIIFTGQMAKEHLAHLYANAGLFVLPSYHEGLPICALEAGALGCPLLLSDIAGNRDLGLPGAHYFRSGDVTSLSQALRAPFENYAVAPTMFERFDWDRITASTLGIYQSVLASPRAPG